MCDDMENSLYNFDYEGVLKTIRLFGEGRLMESSSGLGVGRLEEFQIFSFS